MKFTTPLITILSIASVYSYTLEKREDTPNLINNNNDNNKNNTINDPFNGSLNQSNDTLTEVRDIIGTQFSKECQEVLLKYTNCLPTIEKDNSNYDQSCKIYNSDECTKLLSTSVTSNEYCKDAKVFEQYVNDTINVLDLTCAMENGEYCPISKLKKEGKLITKEAVTESCKSNICREKAISGVTSLKRISEMVNNVIKTSKMQKREEFKDLNEILSILNGPMCIAQASNAFAAKMGSSLLLTIALFFYFL